MEINDPHIRELVLGGHPIIANLTRIKCHAPGESMVRLRRFGFYAAGRYNNWHRLSEGCSCGARR